MQNLLAPGLALVTLAMTSSSPADDDVVGGLQSRLHARGVYHRVLSSEDLTCWSYWWEFNKDPFLRLRDAVHSSPEEWDDWLCGARYERNDHMRPTPEQIRDEVLPALKRRLDASSSSDLTSSCMIALAKIGEDHPTFRILPLFEQRLAEADQQIRETAALAMGLSRRPDALPRPRTSDKHSVQVVLGGEQVSTDRVPRS